MNTLTIITSLLDLHFYYGKTQEAYIYIVYSICTYSVLLTQGSSQIVFKKIGNQFFVKPKTSIYFVFKKRVFAKKLNS